MKLTSGDTEIAPDLTYKNHHFVLSKVGKGWRVKIYAPRSLSPLRESPTNLEDSSKEAIIAEAKWIVDARCTVGPTG